MMSFFAALFTFFMVGCSKPANAIAWSECAQKIGEHPCNFTLNDQNGNLWELYGHVGTPILIEFSAEWCYWCYEATSAIVQLKKQYDFTYVTILLEDRQGNPANQRLAKKWADLHGSTDPVLHGWKSEYGWPFEGLPAFYMISDKMVITRQMDGWHPQAIEYFIKEEQ